MKSIWNGSISFGLVSININIYSAIQEHTLGFKLLCKKCHTPITYERWCKNCNKEVAWHDVVKGLKLPDGTYFILTQEKLHELRAVKTDTIDIKEFVDAGEIKPIYLESHYYIVPAKLAEKTYFLFKRALEETNKVAIGQFVMRDKEYICVIKPQDNVLLLSTLHYSYEIRDLSGVAVLKKEPKIDIQELKLAEQLISKLTRKKFNLDQYKDSFAENVLKELKKKQKESKSGKSKKTGKTKKQTEIRPANKKESNLITSLRQSLIAPSKTRQPVARAKSRK